MSVFFRRRGEPPVLPITVTITGTGDARYCYATINGTKQYSAGTHEVYAGDTITFCVYGSSKDTSSYGSVTIDGTRVLKVTGGSTKTYNWTVPSGISTIEIAMKDSNTFTTITVTTA